MEGLPIYWGDLNHHQDNLGDPTQETLPLTDGNVQMTLWIPFHSTQTSVAPVLFQRANTAPVQVCPDHCVATRQISLSRTDWGTSIQPTRLRICTILLMKLTDMPGALLLPRYKDPCRTLRGAVEQKSKHKHKASHPPSRRMNRRNGYYGKSDEEARIGKREPHSSL
jgi:hypothetical protein